LNRSGSALENFSATVLHELLQGSPHRLQLLYLLVQLGDMGLRDTANVSARAAPVLPETGELFDLLHRKAEIARCHAQNAQPRAV